MARGKYDGVIRKLKADGPGGDTRFRDRVEARKREIVELEKKLIGAVKPAALALRYGNARRTKELIGEQETDANVEVQALEELVQTTFEEEGVEEMRVTLSDGSSVSVSVSSEPAASVINQEALVAWLKENGYERLLTVYSNTAASLAKEILLEGGETEVNEDGDITVMGGAVRVRSRRKTTLRKG